MHKKKYAICICNLSIYLSMKTFKPKIKLLLHK